MKQSHRFDLFDKLEIGRKYHMLTCISIRPTILRCDCGKEVRRSFSHLQGGLRSCGCAYYHNNKPFDQIAKERGLMALGRVGPDVKYPYRRWKTKCMLCGHERIQKETVVRQMNFNRYGCVKCCRVNKAKALLEKRED